MNFTAEVIKSKGCGNEPVLKFRLIQQADHVHVIDNNYHSIMFSLNN